MSYVYDKAKYHHGSILSMGLPEEHAENHTVFFLRWLLETQLVSNQFLKNSRDILSQYASGLSSIHEIYRWWDTTLASDMLTETGNSFARFYFDFENGTYLPDYQQILQKGLPSEFHVKYSEENYQLLKLRLDQRYRNWEESQTPEA